MLKKIGKMAIVQELIGYLFYLYTRFVFHTTRWTAEGWPYSFDDEKRPFFMSFWHGRLMGATFAKFYFKPKKLQPYVLISLHRDGRAVAAAMRHYGIKTVDGSSKRNGTAAGLAIMRLMKEDALMAMAPDGRKPGYKMTKGLVALASESRCPIVFTAFSVKRAKIFKTWDKFMLPMPFNKGVILCSEPIEVPSDLNAEQTEVWREKLEKRLLDLTRAADERAGRGTSPESQEGKMNLLSMYKAVTVLAYPLIAIYLAVRKAKGKEDLKRFPERMGYAGMPRPDGRLIWIHGASVGETLSALPLINRLGELYPDARVMMTSGTVTSAELMAKRLPANAFHQFVPIDTPSAVKRFVDYWKPDAVLWIESEFWPNLLSEISSRKIPLILINGRVSDRSFERWRKFPVFCRELQGLFTKSFGQTDEDARRLQVLGAKNADCVGNLKFASKDLPYDADEFAKLEKQIANRPCWIAASTHAGEEEQLAFAQNALKTKGALMILAPRHPKRGDEIEKILTQAGLHVARRSRHEDITPETTVYLADTIGEMGLFYRLAEIAFVGGSLVAFGGQNIIEPARLGKAVVCGKYMMNFKEIVAKATAADALTVVEDKEQLTQTLDAWFSDKETLHTIQQNARAFALNQADVLNRLTTALAPYLDFDERKDNAD